MSMIINLSTTHVSCKSVKKFLFRATLNYHFFYFFFCVFYHYLVCFGLFGLVWIGLTLASIYGFFYLFPPFFPILLCLCMRVLMSLYHCVYGTFLFFSLNGSRLQ